MKRLIKTLIASACVGLAPVLPAQAQTQTFPDKPVRIIVPFTAGGPTDVFFRKLGEELQQVWKQPVIIDNRPGANESIAAIATARSAPDGYTLFGASEGALLLNPLLYKSLSYDPQRDFAPVAQLANGPLIFAVPSALPPKTWQEFVEYAKARKEPIRFGNTGVGGTTHLSFGVLERQVGIPALHVSYRGVINVLQDMMGGSVDAGVIGAPLLAPYVKEGRMRALAVPGGRRVPSMPDVPTFEELGLPQMRAIYELTLVAPVGTPSAIVDKIAEDAGKIVLSDSFRKDQLDPFGLVPVASKPAEFAAYLKSERDVRAALIQASGVEPQ